MTKKGWSVAFFWRGGGTTLTPRTCTTAAASVYFASGPGGQGPGFLRLFLRPLLYRPSQRQGRRAKRGRRGRNRRQRCLPSLSTLALPFSFVANFAHDHHGTLVIGTCRAGPRGVSSSETAPAGRLATAKRPKANTTISLSRRVGCLRRVHSWLTQKVHTPGSASLRPP